MVRVEITKIYATKIRIRRIITKSIIQILKSYIIRRRILHKRGPLKKRNAQHHTKY